jgi:hypothetical protein
MKQKSELGSRDRTEDITPEEVRSLDTFKDWDEERIAELIRTIKTLSKIMYNNFAREKQTGKVIAVNIKNKQNIAA